MTSNLKPSKKWENQVIFWDLKAENILFGVQIDAE